MTRAVVIRAVELARAGDQAGASALIQVLDADPDACWLRACLLKLAGDEAGARSWYKRSNQFYECYSDARSELAAIHAALTY